MKLSDATSILAMLAHAGAAEGEAQTVITFITGAVQAAEATGKKGDEKLAAVLNGVEAYIAETLPHVAVDLQGLAAAVETFVNDLVAIYNRVGLFVQTVKAVIKGGKLLKAVKAAAAHPAAA